MEYFNKARELGKAIVETDEYKRLRAIEAEIDMLKRHNGDYSEEDSEKLKKLYEEYNETQKEFDEIIRNINIIVSNYANIKSEKSRCGSCSSCHDE